MDESNPYEAPKCSALSALPDGPGKRHEGKRHYLAWSVVFILNMVVPLMVGWHATSEHGRIGMAAAAMFLYSLGCRVCSDRREFAAPLIVGAASVALTQLFPVIQIIAGVIGMGVGKVLGLADFSDDEGYGVRGEFGGFVVTFVTGGVLIATSAVCGLLIRAVTPERWWRRSVGVSDV